MFQFDPKDIVKFENFVCECFLPDDDLDSVFTLEVNDFVEDATNACGLKKLALIDGSEIFEAIFILKTPEKHLRSNFILFRFFNDEAGKT